jgi:predicted ester cyclase
MTLFRFERGLIQEEWSVFNMYSILKQLGLLTPPGA